MTNDISPRPSLRRGVVAILHKGKSAVITATVVFVIGGALLISNGSDRSSEGSTEAVDTNTGAIADPNTSFQFYGTPTTVPSSIQYASSADSGEALVSGTSSLHDWTVKSIIINGSAEFSGEWKAGSAPPITLQSADLVIPGRSLKSTEGSGMDNTMYNALKLKQFPTIAYKLTKASLKASPSKQESAYHFDATGQLTISGVTHQVNLDLSVIPRDDKSLTITTDLKLKMSDFGIKPPTAMLGVIKSGDPITVIVNWHLTTPPPPARDGK